VEAKVKESAQNGGKPGMTIPESLKPADKDNDGLITTAEITAAIDSFFDGESSFTVEKLNELIDFFFDQ
jgi:hypothetical protein